MPFVFLSAALIPYYFIVSRGTPGFIFGIVRYWKINNGNHTRAIIQLISSVINRSNSLREAMNSTYI